MLLRIWDSHVSGLSVPPGMCRSRRFAAQGKCRRLSAMASIIVIMQNKLRQVKGQSSPYSRAELQMLPTCHGGPNKQAAHDLSYKKQISHGIKAAA